MPEPEEPVVTKAVSVHVLPVPSESVPFFPTLALRVIA
jgi:hypothetical protein